MNREELQKRLNATMLLISQTESAYQQMLGRRYCLEELLVEVDEGEKNENKEKAE